MADRRENEQPQEPLLPEEGSAEFRLYEFAVGEDEARMCRDIPDAQCREEPRSFLWQIVSQALSKTGDALSDTKTVMPWLMGAVGAPVFLIGLIVPIRESLSLLPQILIGGVIRRFPVRKGFWVAASLVEGLCVVAMAVIGLLGLTGAPAGWSILGFLVIFSLARGVASIASKDTLGKTVSKGKRGRVSGYAATISGIAGGAVGLYLVLSPEAARPDWLLFAMILVAGVSWFLAAASFWRIQEEPGATDGGRGLKDLVQDQLSLLWRDRELQKFLLSRALMISTALVGPVYVSLAQRETGSGLENLGWLIVATGLAGTVSASIWGAMSDRSSRATMAAAALLSAALGVAVVLSFEIAPFLTGERWFYAAILFVMAISHAGVRIGRKTHIVDIASGDNKAEYVALSNTLIGVMLLVIGGVSSVLLAFGQEVAILAFSALAAVGALVAFTMKNAQAED